MNLCEASVDAICSLQVAVKEFEARFAKVEDFDWNEVEADKRYHGRSEPWMAPANAGRYRTFCGCYEKEQHAPIPLRAVDVDREQLVREWLRGMLAIFVEPGSTLYWRIRPGFEAYDGSKKRVFIRCRMTWKRAP